MLEALGLGMEAARGTVLGAAVFRARASALFAASDNCPAGLTASFAVVRRATPVVALSRSISVAKPDADCDGPAAIGAADGRWTVLGGLVVAAAALGVVKIRTRKQGAKRSERMGAYCALKSDHRSNRWAKTVNGSHPIEKMR